MNIEKPWIIANETLEGKLQIALVGPEGAEVEDFAIVAADIIKHVARCFNRQEEEVLTLIRRELDEPTSGIAGGVVQ
jgi:hypothetical protein